MVQRDGVGADVPCMTRRDFEPPPRTFTKPPIKREYDARVVRQDRWARRVGWMLAIALVPLLLTGAVAWGMGMRRIPVVLHVVLGGCMLIGIIGAVLVIVMWALVDRD